MGQKVTLFPATTLRERGQIKTLPVKFNEGKKVPALIATFRMNKHFVKEASRPANVSEVKTFGVSKRPLLTVSRP